MRLYPSLPGPRARTVSLDLLVLAGLLAAAWLGVRVHDAVLELNALSRGVVGAGTQAERTLREAGDAVGGVPVVGGELAGRLRAAGADTGGAVAAAGRDGAARVSALADLLGVVAWLVPTVALLAHALPPRVRQARRLAAGARVLVGAAGTPATVPAAGVARSRRSPAAPCDTPAPLEPTALERRRLVAQRAAFGLPYGALLRHTPDPLGDLHAGRYDGLVAAELEAAGLAPTASN